MSQITYLNPEEFEKEFIAHMDKKMEEAGINYLPALPEETAILEWCKIVTK